MKILEAFEERNKILRKELPNLPDCKIEGCNNPVDVTMMGQDTCCIYHRMLWDYYMYPRVDTMNVEDIRKGFFEWLQETPKDELDKCAIYMGNDKLNWVA